MKRKRFIAVLAAASLMMTAMPAVSYAGNLDPDSNAKEVALQVAAEGAVLLENNGVLPIQKDSSKLAVFGRTQVDICKGGGGSGTVHTNASYNFIQGFEEAGIQYDKDLAEIYAKWCADNSAEDDSSTFGTMGNGASQVEMPVDGLNMEEIAGRTDMAVVIFGRNSSEGGDRSAIAGDWYLSEGEEQLLQVVSNSFEKVLVILNTGGMMDAGFIDTYNVDAVLQAWQPGGYGAVSVGKIITGEINPSGSLMDTWAYEYDSYPAQSVASASFGKNVINPVYGEDIYVGYRYFETFAPDEVRYEFGYGLSYTSFDYKIKDTSIDDTNISVTVDVTNTGNCSGKEVIQAYYSAPTGLLGKAAYEMAAFDKTPELAPGETCTLTLSFETEDMASYDDSGVTEHESCYVMEAGDYNIYVGPTVKELTQAGTYTLDELKVTQELSEVLAPTFAFDVAAAVQDDDGNYVMNMVKAALRSGDNKVESKWDTDLEAYELTGEDKNIKLGHVADGTAKMQEFVSQFTLPELIQLFGGIYGVRTDNYHYFPESAAGAAGGIGQTLENRGVNFSVMADGPAGLRLTMDEDDSGNTYFPMGTMQACTWNLELLEQTGAEIGKEAVYNQVSVWLAPAINIHRDPLCGRNFEYYSEDPVLAGLCGAAITKGVQSADVGVAVKHFALNNQEYSRSGGDSIVTERAQREIYLKGFQILTEEADPWFIMTSYNRINGSYAATNYELLTTVLRDEWGFKGSVMTDWASGKDNGNASMIRAQGDLCMPSLVGRADPQLPEGFTTTGATDSWYGTVHSGNIYCEYCNTEYGDYSLFKINNLYVPASEPCFDENGVVESCNRPYEEAATPTLPEGYTFDKDFVYDAEGNAVVGYAEWLLDRTGLITGYVSGDVTLGEIERCAENVFNSIILINGYQSVDGDSAQ
ncbi:glycoside hydrolase family 3 C-terminal domain-containing protein [Blautia schinkii]|nr:glycoside hydrolase family 3 C-terminal domain-containing protein [Blautia schinkii]